MGKQSATFRTKMIQLSSIVCRQTRAQLIPRPGIRLMTSNREVLTRGEAGEMKSQCFEKIDEF